MLPLPYHLDVVCRVLEGLDHQGEHRAPVITLAACHLRLLALLSRSRAMGGSPGAALPPATGRVDSPLRQAAAPARNLIADGGCHVLQ